MSLAIVQFQKISIPPHGWSLEIPRGWGVSKANIFKGKYGAKLEFPGGGGGIQSEKPSVGVWIFSGTTHCHLHYIFDHFLTTP